MQTYEVHPNDSPASIAARYAGCMKCSRDLVHANPHKPTVTMPNGFVTFRDLRIGETLNLPDKWFNGELDMLPAAYFAALPYADGVTPGVQGITPAMPSGLGDQAALASAQALVNAMPAMDDPTFSNAVGNTGTAIDQAVGEAYGSPNAQAAQAAQDVQIGTQWAWNRNADLAALIGGGASSQGPGDSIQQAREDIFNALNTALGNAQIALTALATPAAPPAPGPVVRPAPARPPSPRPGPIAVRCPAGTTWNGSACVAPQPPGGMSTAAVVGIGLLGAAAVGGVAYVAMRRRKSSGMRREHRYEP